MRAARYVTAVHTRSAPAWVIVGTWLLAACERRPLAPSPADHHAPQTIAVEAGSSSTPASDEATKRIQPSDVCLGSGAKVFLVCGDELVERDGPRLRTARIETSGGTTTLLSASSTDDEVIGRSSDSTTLFWWHGDRVERFSDGSSWRSRRLVPQGAQSPFAQWLLAHWSLR